MVRRHSRRRVVGLSSHDHHVCQPLEPRVFLSAVSWDGGGDGVNWTSAGNWSTDSVPGSADDVTISVAASPSIQVSGSQSINSLTCDEALSIPGGELSIDEASTMTAALSLIGGSLAGNGLVTCSGVVTFGGNATMKGAGTTTIAAGGILNITSNVFVYDSRLIENFGTVNWTGGSIEVNNSAFPGQARIFNRTGGVFNHNGAGGLTTNSLQWGLSNQGTINKLLAGTFTLNSAYLYQSGAVNVQAGTMVLAAGLGNSGTFNTNAGATLQFSSSSDQYAGNQYLGAGSLLISSGTHTATDITVTISQPTTLTGGSATLTTGNWLFTSSLTWTGSTMRGAGTTTIAAGGILNITSNVFVHDSRLIENFGTVNWTGGSIEIGDSTFPGQNRFFNRTGGVLNHNGAAALTNTGTQWGFVNEGVVNQFGGTNFNLSGAHLDNNGVVNVQAQTLTTDRGVIQVSGNTLTAGNWNISNGATLSFPGTSLNTIGGSASVSLTGTSSAFAAINALSAVNGTFTLAGGRDFTTTASLTNSGGTINLGSGSTLSVSGAFSQPGSTLHVDIGGPTASTDFGQITSTGTITLAGSLTASLVNGYDPAFTVNFPVVVGTSRSGAFGSFTGATSASGRPLRARYSATSAIVGVAPQTPSIPGLDSASDSGVSTSDDITNDNTPSFTGTAENGTTVRLFANGVEVGSAAVAGGTYSITASALADGARNMTATAEDADVDVSDASAALVTTIDTAAPAVPGAPDLQAASDSGFSSTDNITNDNTPTLDFASTDTYYRLLRNGSQISGDYATGTTITESTLSDATYAYILRAVDAAGNVSSDSPALSVTIDTAAPAAPGAPDLQAASDSGFSPTDDITNDNTPSFDLASTDTYFRFERGGTQISGDYESGTTFTTAAQADGSFAFAVRAVDAAGNVSAPGSALSVTIDTVAPAIPGAPDLQAGSDSGVSQTDDITNDNTPTLDVTSTDTYYRLSRGATQVSGDYSTAATFTDSSQADGAYSYTTRAVDAAGNVSSDSPALNVTIDTAAPAAPGSPDLQAGSDSGVSPSDDITNDNTPSFDVASTDTYFRFERAGTQISGDYETGTTLTTAAQSDGTFSFAIRAVDAAGNASAPGSALSVTIDTVAPTVPAAPDLQAGSDSGVSQTDDITNDNTPALDVTSTDLYYRLLRDGSQVSIDYATGVFTSAALTDGVYTFTVRAVDAAGNVSTGSAGLSVTIDTIGLAAPTRFFAFETGHSLVFNFGEDVGGSLAAADLSVVNLGTGVPVSVALAYSPNTATFTFPVFGGGILPDGNYRGTIAAANVTDVAGNPLGAESVLDFFVFAGDANRNRSINIADFSILASRFNLPGTFSQGDFDYNGTTGIGDFSILASKFNTSLAVPGSMPRTAVASAAALAKTQGDASALVRILDALFAAR